MPNLFKRIGNLFKRNEASEEVNKSKNKKKEERKKERKNKKAKAEAKKLSNNLKRTNKNSTGKRGIGVSKAKSGDNGNRLLKTIANVINRKPKSNKSNTSKQEKESITNDTTQRKVEDVKSIPESVNDTNEILDNTIQSEINNIESNMEDLVQTKKNDIDVNDKSQDTKREVDSKDNKERLESKEREKLRKEGKFNENAFNRLMENIFYEATEGNSVDVEGELNNRGMKGLQTQISILRSILVQDIATTKNEFWSWLEDNWQNYSLKTFRYGSDSNAQMGVVTGMSDYKTMISKAYDDYKSTMDDIQRYKEEKDKENNILKQAQQSYDVNIKSSLDKLIDESIRRED